MEGLYEEKTDDQLLSLLSMKALTELDGVKDYFFVTSSISGIINSDLLNIPENNVWEILGSLKYYQCDHG